MRLIKALLALLFVLLGVLFSALNRDPVQVDLGFAAVDTYLGAALLFALLVGAVLAGLVLLAGVVWPRRRRTGEPAVPAKAGDPEGHD
ncbi:lipopolysaccharide assembly protein LapA domain-containing protein [Arenimonas fontis]|uniref:DUF1049 domain-containing protein n=1 Tax=Arenimonas fontis TaxID=2608255 RepID=A0A5B2ZDG4_9GAMM|nr:lipopolysaccharide assembly protein LapA domain-containing protein [Arenimonas fontis]KAA2285985.1 DUF1049 domain-containing protein [Arenimonas fontis]